MIGFIGWLGALAMAGAPFIIDTSEGKILAIVGLAFLSVQAIDSKLYNLLLLNLAGIGGYTYALYF